MSLRDEFESNPFAAPETDFVAGIDRERSTRIRYAGFWQRWVAALIDNTLLRIISALITPVLTTAMDSSADGDHAIFVAVAVIMAGFSVGWLYYALQESSAAQATIGKRAMGLKVVDLNGEQISFGRATGRYFGRILSLLILLIGYLMQPFTEKKQALHDIMAGTLVIKG